MATYGGMPSVDFSILGDLGKTYQESKLKAGRERSLAELGQGAKIEDVSRSLFQAGDIEGGLSLAKLADAQAMRQHTISRQGQEDAFRRQEAQRAQGNADRSFGLQREQFNATMEGQRVPPGFQRTEGGLAPVPGGPQDPAYLDRANAAKGTNVGQQVEERRKAAVAQGLDIADPTTRAYILTGKLPREDQQPLTATDKKAILEADEMVLTNEGAITALKQAKEVSPKAYGHPGAGARGKVDALLGNEEGLATVDLDNIVIGTALGQLKSLFGAAPTEGERKILLELQGSTALPDAARQKIFDRAIVLAEKRLEFNRKRSEELRGGTFYKPGGKSQDKVPPGSMLPGVGQPQIIGGGSSAPAEKKRLKFNPATGELE